MDWIWTIVIGLVAGLVAKLLTPGSGTRGLAATTALGIGGSLAAMGLGRLAGLYHAGQSAAFIAALIGSVLLLLGHRLIAKR